MFSHRLDIKEVLMKKTKEEEKNCKRSGFVEEADNSQI